MFSFGMIKHSTAFQGAVTIVREENNLANMPFTSGLYKQMTWIQDAYKLYSLSEYRTKVFKALAAWTLTTKEPVLGSALKYCKMRSIDLQDELISRLRGFPADEDFLAKFR